VAPQPPRNGTAAVPRRQVTAPKHTTDTKTHTKRRQGAYNGRPLVFNFVSSSSYICNNNAKSYQNKKYLKHHANKKTRETHIFAVEIFAN
jgi:hypothetical protein